MGDIFQTMDRFMRNMDSVDHFFSTIMDRPSIGFYDQRYPNQNHNPNRTLRDQFFEQDEKLSRRQDRDFDDVVDKHGIEAIFNEGSLMNRSTQPQFNSFAKSFQYTRVMGNDGKMEERRIERDSFGNKIETFTRALGDKSYSITTKEDKTGLKERNEDMINMDENDIQSFDREWNSYHGGTRPVLSSQSDIKAIENKPSKKESWKDKLRSWIHF